MYQYSVFGISLSSEFAIPELRIGVFDQPDLTIRLGHVPDSLEEVKDSGICYQVNNEQVLLSVDGIGSFLLNSGRTITVDPPRTDENLIRLILLNNVLGLILHQRGYSVLQAGAVLIENQCYAFAGTTGCGKSTLMAAFHQRGYQVVSDGICALCLVENRPPRILPGYPFIQAWKETFKALQIDPGQCKRVRPELEKWLYPTFANCKTLEIQVFAGKTRYFLCMEYMDYLIKISGTRIPCGQPVDFALRAKSTA